MILSTYVIFASLCYHCIIICFIDIRSEFFVLHNEAEEKQEMRKFKAVTKKKCSPKSLLKAFGYEACGEVSYVDTSVDRNAPYFPLTGPASFSLVIKKKDAPRGFKLTSKYIRVSGN